MTIDRGRQRAEVHPKQLERRQPADGKRLEALRRRLKLENNTDVIAEAIAVLLLITDKGRRSFFVEGSNKELIKIDL